jgi:hypothetical protein
LCVFALKSRAQLEREGLHWQVHDFLRRRPLHIFFLWTKWRKINLVSFHK